MEIAVKQFTNQELDVLRKEIQASLDIIKSRHGLSELTLNTIRFTAVSFTATINGKVKNFLAEDFEKNQAKFFAIRHGLPEDLIGCKFLMEGGVFEITQIVTSRPKYPITAHCKEDGRSFKFSVERIKELLQGFRVIDI